MHGCAELDELGDTPKAYHDRFQLAYRDGRALPKSEYPIERLIGGERYSGLVVTLTRKDQPGREHILQLRGLHLPPAEGAPGCFALVICDVTEATEAEERFERMFNANPAPAVIVRVADLRYLRGPGAPTPSRDGAAPK